MGSTKAADLRCDVRPPSSQAIVLNRGVLIESEVAICKLVF